MRVKQYYYKSVKVLRKVDFFIKEISTDFYDGILEKLRIQDKALSFSKDDTKIRLVFAGQFPNHRVIKHMKWLSRNDKFEIILVCHRQTPDKDLSNNFYSKYLFYIYPR